MRPDQAARRLAGVGVLLLAVLLILRGLSVADQFSSPLIADMEEEPQPVLREYVLSESGQSVSFGLTLSPSEKPIAPAWYTARLSDGLPFPTDRPAEPDISPYVLRNNQLFFQQSDGNILAAVSRNGARVEDASLSPDRKWMAFAATRGGGPASLYITTVGAKLLWLGEEEEIRDLAWSPDSQRLAYTAPREGVAQVIAIDREGQKLLQVTTGSPPKSSPVWLADGQSLVYLAGMDAQAGGEASALNESSASAAIYLTHLAGAPPARLVDGVPGDSALRFVPPNLVSYTAPQPDHPTFFDLFVVDPQTAQTRRVYPPLAIDALECPASFNSSNAVNIKITISNTSLQPASLPLILRAAGHPLQNTADREADAVRIESIDLSPGETRQVEWLVKPAPGLATYLSALVNLVEFYPMSAQSCRVPNKYLGLPRLPYLPATLPPLIPGLLLCIPWLRHKKNVWLWSAIPVYLTILIGLIVVEIQVVAAQGF